MAVRKLGEVTVGTIAKLRSMAPVTEFIIANQESSRTALIRKDIQNMGSYTSQDEPNVTSECNLLYNRWTPKSESISSISAFMAPSGCAIGQFSCKTDGPTSAAINAGLPITEEKQKSGGQVPHLIWVGIILSTSREARIAITVREAKIVVSARLLS